MVTEEQNNPFFTKLALTPHPLSSNTDKLRSEDVWRRNVDDETLRNTLISLMAAKLGYGVRHLQATDTEALVELANCETPYAEGTSTSS